MSSTDAAGMLQWVPAVCAWGACQWDHGACLSSALSVDSKGGRASESRDQVSGVR